MANRTPFYQKHVDLGGKVVDFAGWDMPVQYSTITNEHNAVRSGVGIFDISHMGQVVVFGNDALLYLQNLTTNDVAKLSTGKGQYSHFLTPKGTVVDDIYVFQIEDQKYLVIVNASRREPILQWMTQHAGGFHVQILEAPQAAGLAVQGPKSPDLMDKLNSHIPSLRRNEIDNFDIGDVSSLVSRTGYTGEDGFELFAPAGHLLIIWDLLFRIGREAGLTPCGLGARDTLRTEAAYPLYGHELDDRHTPLEAGLSWVVKFDKGDFVGRDALLKQKNEGLKKKLFGFKVESGGVARPGGKIWQNGRPQEDVASGTFSPTLGIPIGMSYLSAETPEEGAPLKIRQGARELKGETVKLPFYKRPVLKT